ncbi:hypothetical protein SNE40_002042 [Patella caerulea]|uniref:Microsomal glutathione S-transferase 1 n=1 Tax=Patella caerulea TaxID=87958 RepID=A0AAN8K6E8_PATCE
MSAIYTLDNPVFRDFAIHSTAVMLKTLAMGPVTLYYRVRNKAYCNKEDTVWVGEKGAKPVLDDEDVERSRRCHLNDLENIVPYFMIGIVYIAARPKPSTALWHFRIFTASRFFFTLAYMIPLPIPSRGFGYYGGLFTTLSMAYTIIKEALNHV